MFLLHSLAVVGVAYWISVLIAETVIDSPEEMRLTPAIRTCFGYFFSILYFTAAWQLMSIGYAWLFGAALLSLYSYGRHGPRFAVTIFARIRTQLREHLRSFGVFMGIAVVFFIPLIIGNAYGPFSEGGGDLTIYGAISRLLTERGHTEHGVPGDLSRIGSNLKEVYDRSQDPQALKAVVADRMASADPATLNYPAAEASANRMIVAQAMTSFAFTPYGMYHFLASGPNYPVYFGIQAFLYCMMIVGAFAFGRRLGSRITGWLAAAMVLASHALVSIPYNSYAAHTFALAFAIVMLNALPAVRLNSAAGLRTYGSGIFCLWSMYVHFLSVVGPLAALGITTRFFNLFAKERAGPPVVAGMTAARRVAKTAAAGIMTLLVAGLVLAASAKSLTFFAGLLERRFSPTGFFAFFGPPIPQFEWKGLSFIFGLMSQQHYLPFVAEYSLLNLVVHVGVVAGVAAVVLGIVVLAMLNAKRGAATAPRDALWLYAALAVTIAIHLYASQSSLYTQAKGAQNVVLWLYALMVLPLAVAMRAGEGIAAQPLLVTRIAQLLMLALVLFCIALAAPRIVFAVKLALGQDRAAILGQSYFDEAAKVRKSDPSPYVLFEPRSSADLYLSEQAFFGARMIPSRHMIVETLDPVTRKSVPTSVPDLIRPDDISHLWLMYAERTPKWKGSPSLHATQTTWKSLRLVDSKVPLVVLFGGDYHRNFGPRPLGATPMPTASFAYVRNGGAMLVLPSGPEVRIVLRLDARVDGEYDRMYAAVGKWAASNGVEMSASGRQITLAWRIEARDKPALKTLVQYDGEYWLNVRSNDKDCNLTCE